MKPIDVFCLFVCFCFFVFFGLFRAAPAAYRVSLARAYSRATQSQCMESTAFHRDALGHATKNPLQSIRMHWASLHGLHCIQSRSIVPQCMESSAFNDAAWNPLHSIGMHFT